MAADGGQEANFRRRAIEWPNHHSKEFHFAAPAANESNVHLKCPKSSQSGAAELDDADESLRRPQSSA